MGVQFGERFSSPKMRQLEDWRPELSRRRRRCDLPSVEVTLLPYNPTFHPPRFLLASVGMTSLRAGGCRLVFHSSPRLKVWLYTGTQRRAFRSSVGVSFGWGLLNAEVVAQVHHIWPQVGQVKKMGRVTKCSYNTRPVTSSGKRQETAIFTSSYASKYS